jgi:hypothetical protein
MKKILSEKNIAAILFLLVFIVFSFAHEDSKKRYSNYNTSIPVISENNAESSLADNQEKLINQTESVIAEVLK